MTAAPDQPFDLGTALADLLAFYAEAGVDIALDEAPHDRLAESAAAARGATQAASQSGFHAALQGPAATPVRTQPAGRLMPGDAPHQFSTVPPPRGGAEPPPPAKTAAKAPLPPDAAVMAAREAAREAASLEELRAILEGFEGCALKVTASRLVFADGVPTAKLMLVGEAPGAEEDRQGKPFVGRAGQLLDRMLAAIGLDRTKVYIANIVPWRPPGNRTPTPQESAICLPFITRQIELVDPAVLVFLGGFAASSLIGTKDGILKTRGRWLSYAAGSRDIRAMATLHPAYLLRQPLQKRLAWRDFLAVKRALDEAAAKAAAG
jgi:DNA polymerase